MEMSANKKFLRIEVIRLESVGEGRVPNKAGRRCFVTLNMETSTTHAEPSTGSTWPSRNPTGLKAGSEGFFTIKGFVQLCSLGKLMLSTSLFG